MRVKLTVSYIGTHYNGYQSQVEGNTIQDKLEKALSAYFGGQPIRVYGAGRTDAGVHANGQVVHFDIDKDVNCYKLCLGVNINLPSDISVVDASIVPHDFDARFGAKDKTYCYRLYYSSSRIPLLDINHAQIYRPLSLQLLTQASQLFLGSHDFVAFCNSGSNVKGSIRTINSIDISMPTDNTVEIYINGNAFLYNMVRLMVGAMVNYAKGVLTLQDISDMLDSGKRGKTTITTMPSCGLTLEHINY